MKMVNNSIFNTETTWKIKSGKIGDKNIIVTVCYKLLFTQL